MKDSFITIERQEIFEQTISRSRFLGRVCRISSEDEARGFIREIREEYRDATHHCSAYVQGLDGEHEFADDNGEPSGTAGRPILGALRSAGLTNVCLVVIRYYGGKKLGVRGLIEAYGSTASRLLELCGSREETLNRQFALRMAYPEVNRVLYLMEQNGARVLEKNFGETVWIRASVRARDFAVLEELLSPWGEFREEGSGF